MDSETQRSIEEAVLDILRNANMDEMTEFKVRTFAEDRLGIDLSTPDRKSFVRSVVESFLASHNEDDAVASEAADAPQEEQQNVEVAAEEEEAEEEEDNHRKRRGPREYDEEGDLIVCRLSNKRRVTVQDFRGKTLVSIREYYEKQGKQLPSSKVVAITFRLGYICHVSIGSAVLAHLYRELYHATRPTRTYIAGCVALLQVWSWERLYVGRPTLRVPHVADLEGRPLGSRWGEDRIREIPLGNTMMYRDELDGLRLSQVKMTPYTEEILASLPERCRVSRELWTARVPMISWKCAEWHLADRVMSQFGGVQLTKLEPMERGFKRIDGRGRANIDWTIKYMTYIGMSNNIHAYLVPVIPPEGNGNQELGTYLRWYRSWASIYLLQSQTLPPETIFPRSPGERLMADYFIRSYNLLKPLSGGHGENASSLQLVVDQVVELADRVQRSIYIDYTSFDTSSYEQPRYRAQPTQGFRRSTSNARSTSTGGYRRQSQGHTQSVDPPRHSMYAGAREFDIATTYDVGQSSMPTQQFSTYDRCSS